MPSVLMLEGCIFLPHHGVVHRDALTIKLRVVFVTVSEDKLPCSQWKLGRVQQLIHGADDRVREAVVKVISKTGRPVTMKRPVQKLFPREIPVVNNDEQPREEQIIDGIRPPRRLAARSADYIWRLVDQ